MMKIKDLREKSIAELEKELEASQKEVFSLRLQQSIGQAPKPHLFKVARKSIARIHTLINERSGK